MIKIILGIIQARSQSKRFPNKIFEEIGGMSILEHCVSKCLRSTVDKWILCIPVDEPELERFEKLAEAYPIYILQYQEKLPGTEANDVLAAFVKSVYWAEAEFDEEVKLIVRMTADCWDIDSAIIDVCVDFTERTYMPIFNSFTEGSTVEVFRRCDLVKANESRDPLDREHVTYHMRKGFDKGSIDTPADLKKAREIYEQRLLRK